jgi:hypothetical protein
VVDLGVEDPNPQDDVPLGGVEFSVKESWKGVSERSVVIYGQGESYWTSVINSCDIEFERGRSYLVYAYSKGENGPLGTDICTATKPLAGAEADLRTLGPPTATLPDTGGSAALLNNATTIVVITLLLFALAGALVVRLRRGERP